LPEAPSCCAEPEFRYLPGWQPASPLLYDKHTQGFFYRYRQIFHRTDIKMLTGIDHGVAGAAELKVFT
jgi:hypothetical protein